MGARNALAALGVLPGKLDRAPRQTLIAMACMSLDAPRKRTSARVYYGGWERLAAAQGMYPNESGRRVIARHIAALTAAGVVEQLTPPAPGRNASWKLILPVDNSRDPVDKPP